MVLQTPGRDSTIRFCFLVIPRTNSPSSPNLWDIIIHTEYCQNVECLELKLASFAILGYLWGPFNPSGEDI